MKSKKPSKPEPEFILFANTPKVPDSFKDEIYYNILASGLKNLKKLLDQIIRDQQISMTKELKYFTHGALPYKPEYVVENGKLILTSKLDPGEILLDSVSEPNWFRRMKYELLNYLANPNEDKMKLKKCQGCNGFFVSTKVDARIKYCAKCSPKSKKTREERRRYQREYRKKTRQEKAAIEHEARIENLIKRAGLSRKEAIEIIEADSKM